MGGDEILHKAYRYHWLAEDVTEEGNLGGPASLGKSWFFCRTLIGNVSGCSEEVGSGRKDQAR